ncbi:hypothetical protein [Streptomyces sp. 142MFCol3.1]|uniref:hypothetical protein n=1 Tax=Streptomyces sp. 142MFCol3.1 TaxID=1172179 RepID=UPI0004059077|nr:hypothetical protein [Streptomyces sp. 142MFCol3.1]
MLRIIDARSGEPTDAVPPRRSLVRVHARPPGLDITGLRVLLVADVLVRALELGGTPVWATSGSVADPDALRASAAALGIRPFEDRRDATGGLGTTHTLQVLTPGSAATEAAPSPGGTADDAAAGDVRVGVAPVEPGGGPEAGSGLGAWAGPGADTGAPDPTVLRLALLQHRRDDPLRLDAAALADAADTLARWRAAVAAWATRPSRPVPEDVRQRLRTAWEDDLDVPGVLGVLRWVEESDVPEGARFETYAYADRLLGLELTRDIGAAS